MADKLKLHYVFERHAQPSKSAEGKAEDAITLDAVRKEFEKGRNLVDYVKQFDAVISGHSSNFRTNHSEAAFLMGLGYLVKDVEGAKKIQTSEACQNFYRGANKKSMFDIVTEADQSVLVHNAAADSIAFDKYPELYAKLRSMTDRSKQYQMALEIYSEQILEKSEAVSGYIGRLIEASQNRPGSAYVRDRGHAPMVDAIALRLLNKPLDLNTIEEVTGKVKEGEGFDLKVYETADKKYYAKLSLANGKEFDVDLNALKQKVYAPPQKVVASSN